MAFACALAFACTHASVWARICSRGPGPGPRCVRVCVGVYAWACICARARVCLCAGVRVRMCAGVCVCGCARAVRAPGRTSARRASWSRATRCSRPPLPWARA
eukprot:6189223-Pleurochrysis_carterae.AAC.1